MPGINNIKNAYNMQNRTAPSRIPFQEGEKFTGRIVAKGAGNDVTIRLSDGWQFIASVDKKVNTENIKLCEFQVDKFENGKMQLKLLNDKNVRQLSNEGNENYEEIIEKENLTKQDMSVLKDMVKHNFPLTKENIEEIKSFLQLKEKLSEGDLNSLNEFAENYITGKGINPESPDALKIKEIFSKLAETMKDLKQNELLTMLENKIIPSPENIESFKKLFQGGASMEEILEKLDSEIKENQSAEINENIKNEAVKNNNSGSIVISDKKAGIETERNLEFNKILNEKLGRDISERLKEGNTAEKLKEIIEKQPFKAEETGQGKNLAEAALKFKFENVLSENQKTSVNLTEAQFKNLYEIINTKESFDRLKEASSIHINSENTYSVNESIKGNKQMPESRNIQNLNLKNQNTAEIKEEIKAKLEHVKNLAENLLKSAGTDEVVSGKIASLLKENINDIKVFNKFNEEYYCMNFKVPVQENDYPCRLIIKDDRKDNKKIDSKNAKMVLTVDTVNLGGIDSFVIMKMGKMDISIKCSREYKNIFEENKQNLIDGLASLKIYADVRIEERLEQADIANTRNFFNTKNKGIINTFV